MQRRAAGQRPVNWALPGPCSRKLCTPIGLSSVSKHLDEALPLHEQALGQAGRQPVVDGPLDQGLHLSGPRGELGGQREGPLVQLLVRHHLVGQADPQRLVGLHLPTGDDEVLGPGRPDEAGQPLRAAPAGDDAEQDLGLAEHGLLRGDPVVAGQGQLAAAAERVARRPRRSRSGGSPAMASMRALDAGAEGPRSSRPQADELVDVGTGGEDPLAAGDDDGAGRVGLAGPAPTSVSLATTPAERAFTFGLSRVTTATPSSRRSTRTRAGRRS